MELYIKAGPEDGQVGDCPFAHYVRCVMHFKGLDCKVIPCKPETKPEWLLNDVGHWRTVHKTKSNMTKSLTGTVLMLTNKRAE